MKSYDNYCRGNISTRDMAGVKKDNTIPLEIAIQKELAYRRKVSSALDLRPDDDSVERLLPHPQQVIFNFGNV